MPSPGQTTGESRPPLPYGLTEGQWMAIDAALALTVLLAAVFNLHPPRADVARPPQGAAAIALVITGQWPSSGSRRLLSPR